MARSKCKNGITTVKKHTRRCPGKRKPKAPPKPPSPPKAPPPLKPMPPKKKPRRAALQHISGPVPTNPLFKTPPKKSPPKSKKKSKKKSPPKSKKSSSDLPKAKRQHADMMDDIATRLENKYASMAADNDINDVFYGGGGWAGDDDNEGRGGYGPGVWA